MKNYFVHDSAFVDDGAEVGENTKIWHNAHVMGSAKIGKNCVVAQNCFVAGIIGDGCKLQNNVNVNEETYALSEMLQWIWRSAIREGNEIWIYIPSRRMRKLLQNWLEN